MKNNPDKVICLGAIAFFSVLVNSPERFTFIGLFNFIYLLVYLGDGTLKHMNTFQEKSAYTGKYVKYGYKMKVIVNSL